MSGVGASIKTWLSAAELAEMNLPGLSSKRNRVVEIATRQGWAERFNAAGEPVARPRAGRGGGYEYHVSLLPTEALAELAKRGLLEGAQAGLKAPSEPTCRADWTWFEAQTDKIKDEAARRLKAIQSIDMYRQGGLGQNASVTLAARDAGASTATLWEWMKLIKGVALADRLPALAPRRKGGGQKAGIPAELFDFFKSYYLRPSPVGYAESHRKTVEYARSIGITDVPVCKAFTRELERTVPASVIKLKRQGIEAVVQMIPAQKRTRAGLHAMQAINIDGHKWDVFVRFPARNGQPERIARPISVVMQDLYSSKILAWRTGEVESAIQTRLTFADLFKTWGIPERVTMDNGRAFASKWITGGAKTRFRFKIREDEPLGLLTMLGVQTHFATPHHGQAKPIERAFRDLSESIAMHPACQGAYTGNRTDRKPEDYATKAVDLEVFEALVAAGIAEYNAREGRRGGTAQGRSYDQVFFESYATAPIGKATEEQLRLALLTAENVRAHRKTGAVELYGNSYYDPALYAVAGQPVVIRFDPDDLTQQVHVYKTTGEYLCTAPMQVQAGFYDVQAAKDRAKLVSDLKKHTREAARAQSIISAADLAAMVAAPIEPAPAPESTVVRPIRTRGNAVRVAQAAPAANRAPVVDRFAAAIERQEQQAREERRPFRVFDGGLSPNPEPERPK